jgi:hypothetical protein
MAVDAPSDLSFSTISTLRYTASVGGHDDSLDAASYRSTTLSDFDFALTPRKRSHTGEWYAETDPEIQLMLEIEKNTRTEEALDAATKALESKTTELHEAMAQLAKERLRVESMRRDSAEAANELDRVLRQGKRANQMVDDEIIQKASELRFKVRGFALQHFSQDIHGLRLE